MLEAHRLAGVGLFFGLALFFGSPALAQPAVPALPQAAGRWLPPAGAAVLQTLDKITGRVRTVEAPIEQTIRFGTLDIMARTCRQRPPEEAPESAAFLEIREIKPGETPRTLFVGWMFASSPAVSALEHAVYDVWIIECKMAAPSGSSSR
ncbi:MAG: DUF2155 domain-containing protein [Alphaproteobacteria bacterium]|nr:DUF2155 domain-containing protein [Alphaproteobacteria bacterium]